MKILPEDFSVEKFGYNARLVKVEDASFITGLRSDEKRTKYMKPLPNDVKMQEEWLRLYKERERKGEDYYFLYTNKKKEPVSVSRISQIDFDRQAGKGGGWIKTRGTKEESLILYRFILYLAFEEVQLEHFYYDIHRENKALFMLLKKIHPSLSFKEKQDFLFFDFDISDYFRSLEQFKKMKIN